jgi:hypothetical protein
MSALGSSVVAEVAVVIFTTVVFIIKISVLCAVVHACNPSYSGGRDQEDHGLKPAQGNSL